MPNLIASMDGLACRDRLVAEPTTIDLHHRTFTAAKQHHVALDRAIEMFASCTSRTAAETAEVSTPHDVCGGGNHETKLAFIRGRVAGVDRAGSVGARMSRGSLADSTAAAGQGPTEARGLGKDVDDEITAKAEIVPSPANTVAGGTIPHFGEQRIRNVCAAEAEMNWRGVATETKMKDEAHTCHLAGRRVNGNRAGTSAMVKEGARVGVDDLPTKEDDVVAASGAGKTSSSAISEGGHDPGRRHCGGQRPRGKGNEGKPRPESAALASGSMEPKVVVGSEAATAATSVDSVDVEACCAGSDWSFVKKVVAGLVVLLFAIGAMALSGAGLLRGTSSSLAGEAGGMSASASSQVRVVAVRRGVTPPSFIPIAECRRSSSTTRRARNNDDEDVRMSMVSLPVATAGKVNIAHTLSEFKGVVKADFGVKEKTGNARALTCSAKVADATVVSGEAIKVAGDGGNTIPFVATPLVINKAKAAIDGNTDACVSGEIDPVRPTWWRGAEQAAEAGNIDHMNDINVGGWSREEGVIANTVSK